MKLRTYDETGRFTSPPEVQDLQRTHNPIKDCVPFKINYTDLEIRTLLYYINMHENVLKNTQRIAALEKRQAELESLILDQTKAQQSESKTSETQEPEGGTSQEPDTKQG